MKDLARVTALVLFTIGLVLLLWIFSSAVLLFLVSLVVASAVRPFAQRLINRGLSKAAAYTLVFVFALAFFGILIGVSFSSLLEELQNAGDALLTFYTRVTLEWPKGAQWQQTIAAELPSRSDLLNQLTGDQGSAVIQTVIGVGSGVFDGLAQLIILISLSTYWAIDRTRFERLWLSLISAKRRSRARAIWHAVEDEVGAYVRSEIIQSTFAGVVLGVSYSLIQLPYPTLLAIWVALAWLVPWVGVVLALIPAVFVGWTVGWPWAVLAGIITIAVFVLLETKVEPRLYGRNRVSPVLVVVMLMVMARYAGILGLLIAPPLAATLQILGRELLLAPATQTIEVTARQQLAALRERLTGLRNSPETQQIAEQPQHLSIITNIETLMDETNKLLSRDRAAAGQTVTTETVIEPTSVAPSA